MKAGRGHKYKAIASECQQGHNHPSRREAKRCNELHLLQRAGKISHLTTQPVFRFSVNGVPLMMRNGQQAKFTPDFQYFDLERGKAIVEDSKGMVVRDYPLRAALFRALNPGIELIEV